MRLQPPKEMDKFLGKNLFDDLDLLNDFIGSHKVVYVDGEKTVKEYLESNEWFNESHVKGFVLDFPDKHQDLALIYLDNYLSNVRKNRTTELSGNSGQLKSYS